MRSRRPLRFHRICTLIPLVLVGCAQTVVNAGHVNLQRAERIYSDVQELRQLNFRTEVPLVVMDQGQANVAIERELARRHDAAALQRDAEVGALTGLYPPGIDLQAQTMRVLSRQIVAFYDAQDREMVLVKGKSAAGLWSRIAGFFTRTDSTSEMLVAHELTHALQDQCFSVHRRIDLITDDDDRRIALRAVVEGDATLVGYGYVSGFIDAETVQTLVAHLERMPRLFDAQSPDTPAALRDSLIFEYTDGTRFVGDAYERGGWSAVNALYLNPPRSTREILEPASYFSHSPPLAITVGGWARALKGWHEVAENTYGELLLRVILTRTADAQGEAGLARGWRGDRMVVLENGAGAITVVWIVAMSDDKFAAAFAQAYQAILRRAAADGAPVAHHVERHGAAVLAIIGPGATQAAELAPAVWRASAIAPSASPGA